MSIQAKTALLFTLVTAGILVFLNLSIYFFTSRLVFNDFFKRLELRAVIASKIKFEQDETSTSTYNELKRQYLETLPQEKEYFLPYDSVTKEITDPYNLNLPGTFYRELVELQGGTGFIQRGIVKHAGFLYRDQTGQYLVIKSAVNEYGIMVRKDLQLVLLSTFIISILIAFIISWVFSKKTFEPVRKIIARVNDISVHNLHLRLENNKGQDEVAQLADTFNNMLDRLQTSFDTQNNFVSNASHEFRTPLTTIIGEADLALSKYRSGEEYRQSLEVILHQAEKVKGLTESLLSLAQSSFDGKKQEWKPLRIDELFFEIKQSFDERDISGQLFLNMEDLPEDDSKVTVEGNGHLLKLAFSNVIINAFKYSNNNFVKVYIQPKKKSILVKVEDSGIGIPSTEIGHIYEPFFRASNSMRYEGYGVGLPLTKAIITLHKGEIHVTSEENIGTIVHITLPLYGQ